MTANGGSRLLGERSIDGGIVGSRRASSGRTVTVNLAESPLGWLFSRNLVTPRQFDAGERLRMDWERAQLAPRVTMSWDAVPPSQGRGGFESAADPTSAQIDARSRFHAAVESAGPGLRTSFGGWCARVRGCARQKARSAGPLGPASSC